MKKLIVLLFLIVGVTNSYTQNFTPSNYNPALWLDASDASTITHSGGKISSWQDKSGNGNYTNQTNSNNQPTFTDVSNGIYFDDNDVLVGNNLQYGVDDMLTLFVVAEPDDNADKGSIIAKGQWTSGNDYRIELGENGYDICIRQEREWNSSGASWDIAHKNIVHTYLDEDNYVGYYLNGSAQETPRQDPGTYTPNNSPFSIGARFNNSNNFKGKIYEVLYFQTKLSRCQILQVEGYLAHKWNMQSIMYVNHPYRDNPFGLCEEIQVFVDENAPNGTVIETLEGTYVNTPVAFTDWRIESEGLYEGMFALNANGELTVADNTHLNYEAFTALNIEVSALASGVRVYGNVRVNINDLPDGDAPKVNSELWGVNGEKWDPRGRLPDFSYVGYKNREASYAYPSNTVDVTTFGANPNDNNSDYTAIMNAINSLGSNGGIVYFPAGTYVIDDIITITEDNIVLLGAGNDANTGTKFYFPLSGEEMIGQTLTNDGGYAIVFSGTNAGPNSNIIENTKMGDRSITVENPSLFEVGDTVNLMYGTYGIPPQPTEGELWDHILNNQNDEWPCSVSWSTGSGGLFMFHTIERIDGNIITLKEPIRLDIDINWNPKVQLRDDWFVKNCGVEDIYMEHLETPQPAHLEEDGYNTIWFLFGLNCWVNNVTIKNSDNGILFKYAGFSEIKDITFEGRAGHHGWTFGYSSHCLAENITYNNNSTDTDDNTWYHSFTLTHKANGNVVSNVYGNGYDISTDFHRNTPWETLITNVDTNWNYDSSGVWCAGPNAGKRTVYWNMGGNGFTSFPLWDDYQTTLVGEMHIQEKFHPEKGWHENVPNIEPGNLYEAQFIRRINLPADPLFTSDANLGNRTNYWERDPSRWQVKDGAYHLYFSDTPELSGNRLGEYSIYNTAMTGDMVVTATMASLENTIINDSANASLITNYQDDANYYYVLISANTSLSGIYKVENGTATLLKSITATLTNNNSIFSFENNSGTLTVYENAVLIDQVADNTFTNGKVGFGSFNDAVVFDDILLQLPPSLSNGDLTNTNSDVKLYPNPTTDVVTLTSTAEEFDVIGVYDSNGRQLTSNVVTKVSVEHFKVDLSNLSTGIYIIKTKTQSYKVLKK